MFSAQSKSCLAVLPLLLLRIAFTLALALVFTGVVGGYAEAARRLPDLTISKVSAPSSASSGATISTSTTVKNRRKATASASSVSYYLSKSASSISGAAHLGDGNVDFLEAGEGITLVTSLDIPPSTPTGTFYLVGVADSANVVRESNERNNIASSGAISVKDSTPPTISDVTTSGVTAGNATITWTTNKASTSQVDHGTTAAYGSSTSPGSSLVTSHAVTLSELTAGKVYHFQVRSKDAAGNVALSTDSTFTTPAPTPAPVPTPTAGNTYYVATTGSDTNPGTETQPFRTLARGVSVLAPGDTLYVKSGTYAESLEDNIPGGSSWSAPVTVAAYPGHTVTLKPNPGAEFVLHFQGPQQYIVIDGLIIDAINTTYDAVKITGGGEASGPAHHIRLIRSEVKNSPGQGVQTSWFADFNEFINSNFHDNGLKTDDPGHTHAFYISTSNNLIEGSVISNNNTGYGVHIYEEEGGRRANNNIVRNNRIFANGYATGGAGIIMGSGDGNTAYNNLIYGNAQGIKVAYFNPLNTTVYNNTIYNNTGYGIEVESDSKNVVVRNNIFYANGGPEIQDYGVGSVTDHNLVGTDPKFVNAAAGDFRVQSGSPAIDAGITVSGVTTDIFGTPRPQGPAYDLGAVERVP